MIQNLIEDGHLDIVIRHFMTRSASLGGFRTLNTTQRNRLLDDLNKDITESVISHRGIHLSRAQLQPIIEALCLEKVKE